MVDEFVLGVSRIGASEYSSCCDDAEDEHGVVDLALLSIS
jgi:hypothetical protein